MEYGNLWSVDRLAAAELLALLKEAPEAEWSNLAATAFCKSRMQSYEWAARRVHGSVIKVLEAEATDMFQYQEPAWTDGFRHAEECLITKAPSDLLELHSRPSQSKGQILRSFLRSAKKLARSSTP